tara:strand:+ start:1398 stop:1601 length:204 start_codon:yes stop_codon:yes gene_type:complete
LINLNLRNYFKMKAKELSVEQQIEEILAEANAYGLRIEVADRAIKIELLHNMSKLDAHQEAYKAIIG